MLIPRWENDRNGDEEQRPRGIHHLDRGQIRPLRQGLHPLGGLRRNPVLHKPSLWRLHSGLAEDMLREMMGKKSVFLSASAQAINAINSVIAS